MRNTKYLNGSLWMMISEATPAINPWLWISCFLPIGNTCPIEMANSVRINIVCKECTPPSQSIASKQSSSQQLLDGVACDKISEFRVMGLLLHLFYCDGIPWWMLCCVGFHAYGSATREWGWLKLYEQEKYFILNIWAVPVVTHHWPFQLAKVVNVDTCCQEVASYFQEVVPCWGSTSVSVVVIDSNS